MEIIYTLRRMEVISCSCEMCCKSHPQDETSVLPSYYQDVGHLKENISHASVFTTMINVRNYIVKLFKKMCIFTGAPGWHSG